MGTSKGGAQSIALVAVHRDGLQQRLRAKAPGDGLSPSRGALMLRARQGIGVSSQKLTSWLSALTATCRVQTVAPAAREMTQHRWMSAPRRCRGSSGV